MRCLKYFNLQLFSFYLGEKTSELTCGSQDINNKCEEFSKIVIPHWIIMHYFALYQETNNTHYKTLASLKAF